MSDDASLKRPSSGPPSVPSDPPKAPAPLPMWKNVLYFFIGRPGERGSSRSVFLAIAAAIVVRVMFYEPFAIEGPSMEPTLNSRDRVLVAKYPFGLFLPFMSQAVATWGAPAVGDVVILKSPYDGEDIVKRVIGVPGDRIEVRDDEVFRNGESIRIRIVGPCRNGSEATFDCEVIEEGVGARRWRISHRQYERYINRDTDEEVVPPGHVYVLGDHRNRSNDSRTIGVVPMNRLRGRVEGIYYLSLRGSLGWQGL